MEFWIFRKCKTFLKCRQTALMDFLEQKCFPDFLDKDVKLKCPNCEQKILLKKNVFGPIWGPKMPKNRVFWTLCLICSLVFPDFLYKDVELKDPYCEKKIFGDLGNHVGLTSMRCY